MQKSTDIHPTIKQIRSLHTPVKGRRLLSWLLFLGFIAVCFALPVYHSMHPEKAAALLESHPKVLKQLKQAFGANTNNEHTNPAIVDPLQKQALAKFTASTPQWQLDRKNTPTYLAVDKLWNPGHPLDQAHQAWATDCKACHSTPFAQVQDKDCKTCHKNAADHVDKKATSVSVLAEATCASCHRDHNGLDGLSRQNKHYMNTNCSDCHSNIKQSYPKTKIQNVKDFAKEHPEFKYQLAASTKPDDLVRTRLTKTGLSEKPGFKFPHDVHLKKGGVKSPKGKVDMNCASCHTPNQDGVNFAPITMKEDCQYCHDLKFEPAVSNREVPHGNVELALSTIREFYSYVQVNTVPVDEKPLTALINLIRPGKDEPKVMSYVSSNGDSRSRASMATVSLFEKTSCNLCHNVTKLSGQGRKGTPGQDLPQYAIGKITPTHPWFVSSVFDHSKHNLADCSDCHAANKSKKAEDVLMPSIDTCRDCHAGKKPVTNKLVSDCGLCHGFHQSAHKLTEKSKEGIKLTAQHENK